MYSLIYFTEYLHKYLTNGELSFKNIILDTVHIDGSSDLLVVKATDEAFAGRYVKNLSV